MASYLGLHHCPASSSERGLGLPREQISTIFRTFAQLRLLPLGLSPWALHKCQNSCLCQNCMLIFGILFERSSRSDMFQYALHILVLWTCTRILCRVSMGGLYQCVICAITSTLNVYWLSMHLPVYCTCSSILCTMHWALSQRRLFLI